MTIATQSKETWTPDWATHPGQHLEEYLEVRGLKQAEFARLAGLTPKLVSEIINQKNPITPETAIALERVLGLKAYIWTNLQSSWDLFQIRKKGREVSPDQKNWLKQFPVNELKARNHLPNTRDLGTQIDALLKLLGIGKPEAYPAKLKSLAVQHRQSKKSESSPHHVFTWLMMGEHKARAMNLPEFNKDLFLAAVKNIRKLTRDAPEEFAPEMMKLCQQAGVALIFEKPITKTCLFGSARWLDSDHAIIQMSLRMKSNDHFWWTFFHECGHIILHRGRNFADDQNAMGDGAETEADHWAENVLYGRNRLAKILEEPPRSKANVRKLANQLEIHPGIIVGMLQHYRVIPHNWFNDLKSSFQWSDE